MSEEMQKSNADNLKPKARPSAPAPEDAAAQESQWHDIDDVASIEHLAETAKAHAYDAAEALRQGHIMEDAEADLSATSDDRLIALLCYWSQLVMPLLMPVIVLLSESGKRRPFQRHHAMQSLGLTGAVIGVSVFMTMAIGMLQIIPFLGVVIALLALCLTPIVYVMIVIAYVFYGWQANKGKRFSIPILSRFLRRQGWLD